MLNRIYIIVGLIAIIALTGAFVLPRFIQWGDYRERMEVLASGVLGADVTIRGDIEFSLLPQPHLSFTDVLIGSPEEPAATVDAVEADFSLMDFLRDNYQVTKLLLREPVVDVTIDQSGFASTGLNVTGHGGGVALTQASIVNATLRIIDERSGSNYVASAVDGDLKIGSFSGPFQFQGAGDYGGERFGVRFNSAATDITGNARVTLGVRPESGAYSLTAEGQLEVGMAPKFDGSMVYRQTPPPAESAGGVRGDLVFTSKVTGSTDRIVLSGYALQPDENRSGTRLTGSVSIQIGARPSFDAVVSGGVLTLPPRDVQEDPTTQPYELLRLLAELPEPPVPSIPGRIGVDLAEIGLRAFALRNLSVAATTDGKAWNVEAVRAQLAGSTQVLASGTLGNESGRPAFRGTLSLTSERLDSLAALWRRPGEDNPLFNMPGALDGKVMLVGDALGLTAGHLTLDGMVHAVELRLGFGEEKRLDVIGNFNALSTIDSAAVGALMPNINNDPVFGRSFPDGSFSLTAQSARVFGQDGTGLVAEGLWSADKISLSHLAAEQWGGVGLNGSLDIAGTLAEPELSGAMQVKVASAAAPGLAPLYAALDTPLAWQNALVASAPADLLVNLGAANEAGGQILSMNGTLGVADFNLRAELAGGLGGLLTEPLRLNGALESEDIAGLTAQVGLGNAELFSGDGSMLVSFAFEGSPTNSLDTHLNAHLGNERVGFTGNLLMTAAGEIQGTGTLDVALGDAGSMAEVVGSQGLSLPLAVGSGQLHFEGERLARLTDIKGKSGDVGFAGELALSRTGTTAAVSGAVTIDVVSIEGLAATLFGRAALVGAVDVWPEGPINTASEPRVTRGTVSVTAPLVTAGGVERMQDATFDLAWDETRLRLSRFEASLGSGKANFDIAVCCEGPLAEKTVTGRVSLVGTPLDSFISPAIAASLGGLLDGGLRFDSSGASLADVMANLAGEGSFTLKDMTVQGLSPKVYPTVAALDDVLNMDPDALSAIVSLALGQGAFEAANAAGTFTIAGGVARLANFIVEGNGGRLAGNLNLALKSLGIEGSFVLTPLGFSDERGLIGEDTARVIARIKGTALAPAVTPDLSELVGAVQVRANELEVDRLEALQAEDAARQRAAAEERNRLIEEQRRKAAEEAARIAAEEAARKAAEEEALRQQQEQQQSAPTAPAPQPTSPQLNLGYQPMVNQPVN